MFNATDFLEAIFIEGGLILEGVIVKAEQTAPAVILEHFRVHARKNGDGIERKERGSARGPASERQRGVGVKDEPVHNFGG